VSGRRSASPSATQAEHPNADSSLFAHLGSAVRAYLREELGGHDDGGVSIAGCAIRGREWSRIRSESTVDPGGDPLGRPMVGTPVPMDSTCLIEVAAAQERMQ